MLRKNQRSLRLTSWQVQQLKPVSHTLRKLNREARHKLRRIKYTDLTRTRYREAGELFGTIATRMLGALRFRHEILKADHEPLRFHLEVHFVEPCVHDYKGSQLTGPGDDDVEREPLKLEPAHQAEILSLLELTNSIEELVSRRSMLRGVPLNEFFRGIHRFRLAVVQQRQHLLATSPQPKLLFDVQFADGPDICPECLKSTEIGGEMEGHDRQV
jgi:hypothetical protein